MYDKRNHTTYALLGLITAGYRTGYEMKRMIDQSLNHFGNQLRANLSRTASINGSRLGRGFSGALGQKQDRKST
ncbi:hypothetical protein PO124_25330 [Bacillus licheniformis]|nr:hypothetical protein [Bacillus licheniformis]